MATTKSARRAPKPSGQRLRVNGVELYVHVEGEGPAVLLLHGFPDCHEVWRKQIPALVEAGYQVIAPDLRGCGASEMPPRRGDYRLTTLIADLAALLDALGIAKVRLIGHDWGAVIGWQFCAAHPDRVDRYVALSVGHPNSYANGGLAQKLKGWYVLFFQIPGAAERLLRARDWLLFRRSTDYPDEAPNWIAKLARPGRLTAAINYYRANPQLLLGNCPRVAVPVLGVWSDGDRFLTEGQMSESGKWMDAPFRYARIAGANHWLQLVMPERINALLLDYLR